MTDEWLQNLKAGDDVIVSSIGIGAIPIIKTVTKRTPTQIVVGSTRFKATNGREIGRTSAWHRDWLEQATPEMVAAVKAHRRKANLVARIQAVNWRGLSLENLEVVAAIVAPDQDTEKT